jgi:hypothetical protein
MGTKIPEFFLNIYLMFLLFSYDLPDKINSNNFVAWNGKNLLQQHNGLKYWSALTKSRR